MHWMVEPVYMVVLLRRFISRQLRQGPWYRAGHEGYTQIAGGKRGRVLFRAVEARRLTRGIHQWFRSFG